MDIPYILEFDFVKQDLRTQAITLRFEGKTYREILAVVPVAKSTLSLWFRSVSLSKEQEQVYSERKRLAGLRGGMARRKERVERTSQIIDSARNEITSLDHERLGLIGATLYWAEGSKEKINGRGQRVAFSNSDPRMILVFLKWLTIYLGVSRQNILFNLYIHENYRLVSEEHVAFWRNTIGVGYNTLERVYVKKHNLSPKRKNVHSNYHGQLNVIVKNSVDLNRRIAGLIEGICSQSGMIK